MKDNKVLEYGTWRDYMYSPRNRNTIGNHIGDAVGILAVVGFAAVVSLIGVLFI